MAGKSTKDLVREVVDRVNNQASLGASQAERIKRCTENTDRLETRIEALEAEIRSFWSKLDEAKAEAPVRRRPPQDLPKFLAVRLRNDHRSPYMAHTVVRNANGEISAIPKAVQAGAVAEFNGLNPSVQVAALAGTLSTVDADGEAWLEGLRG